ncbi:MAG TPA: flagellar hook-basal body complex protein FliE [Armatimonadota bacterium]|nr:flagellar hook-basal body complex protein FliE [Armatimonadota bacterium]
MRIDAVSSTRAPTQVPQGGRRAEGGDFGSVLAGQVSGLAEIQSAADRAAEAVAVGDLSQLHEAVIAMQKASLALELAITVRNHVVEGLKELLHTQT